MKTNAEQIAEWRHVAASLSRQVELAERVMRATRCTFGFRARLDIGTRAYELVLHGRGAFNTVAVDDLGRIVRPAAPAKAGGTALYRAVVAAIAEMGGAWGSKDKDRGASYREASDDYDSCCWGYEE